MPAAPFGRAFALVTTKTLATAKVLVKGNCDLFFGAPNLALVRLFYAYRMGILDPGIHGVRQFVERAGGDGLSAALRWLPRHEPVERDAEDGSHFCYVSDLRLGQLLDHGSHMPWRLESGADRHLRHGETAVFDRFLQTLSEARHGLDRTEDLQSVRTKTLTKVLANAKTLVMGNDTFGFRLREARERAGLSARALSLKAGLAPGHVGTIEGNPDTGPTLSTAAALAEALGVRLEWLASGSGPERVRRSA